MPDQHERTGEGPTIGDDTKVNLKITISLVVLGIAGAGAWFEQKMALSATRYELRAEILAAQTKAEREASYVNGLQDARVSAIENRMSNIQSTVCALARASNVAGTGCGRRDDP